MSKYDPLTIHLEGLSANEWTASFQVLEEVLGFSLPASAQTYSAWWANDATSARHAQAWLSAGWKTSDLNLTGRSVTFLRSGGISAVKEAKVDSAVRASRPEHSFKLEELPVAPGCNPLQLGISMTWRTVGTLCLGDDGGLVFPEVPALPGLYRFRLVGDGAPKSYIGETIHLRRRFAHYRNPGPTQTTNIRINALFMDHLAAGHGIDVDVILQDADMNIGEEPVSVDFSDKAVRRLFENAAIVAEGGQDIESLNR